MIKLKDILNEDFGMAAKQMPKFSSKEAKSIIDNSLKTISNGTKTLNEGDMISIDGGLGEVYIGELQSEPPKPSKEFNTLMDWCDEFKKLKIRANAETSTDTKKIIRVWC